MSIALMAACWKAGPADPIERYALLALSDNASDEGFAFPSLERLAEKMQMDERTVRRKLKSLEAGGWIQVNRKSTGGKGNTYLVLRARLGLDLLRKSPDCVSAESRKSPDSVSAENRKSLDSVSAENRKSPDSVSAEKSKSPASVSAEIPESHRTFSPSHRTFSPESPDFQSEPPHPLKGVTIINHQEPSRGAPIEFDDEEVPSGLSAVQYATGLLEKCGIVGGYSMRTQMAEGIRLLAKTEDVELHEATKRMIGRAIDAQQRGETVNIFWLQDSKWKHRGVKQEFRNGARARDSASIDAARRAALDAG